MRVDRKIIHAASTTSPWGLTIILGQCWNMIAMRDMRCCKQANDARELGQVHLVIEAVRSIVGTQASKRELTGWDGA